MWEDVLEFEDGSIEFVVFSEPYEQWRYYVAEVRRARFHWEQTPNCIGIDMHPTRLSQQAQLAKTVCTGCPVQTQCMYMALVGKEEFGVWGGSTQKERSFIISKLMEVLDNYSQWWFPKYKEPIRATAEQFVISHNLTHNTNST